MKEEEICNKRMKEEEKCNKRMKVGEKCSKRRNKEKRKKITWEFSGHDKLGETVAVSMVVEVYTQRIHRFGQVAHENFNSDNRVPPGKATGYALLPHESIMHTLLRAYLIKVGGVKCAPEKEKRNRRKQPWNAPMLVRWRRVIELFSYLRSFSFPPFSRCLLFLLVVHIVADIVFCCSYAKRGNGIEKRKIHDGTRLSVLICVYCSSRKWSSTKRTKIPFNIYNNNTHYYLLYMQTMETLVYPS